MPLNDHKISPSFQDLGLSPVSNSRLPSTKSQGLIPASTSPQGCPALAGWAFDLANTESKREVIFRVINASLPMENINW